MTKSSPKSKQNDKPLKSSSKNNQTHASASAAASSSLLSSTTYINIILFITWIQTPVLPPPTPHLHLAQL